jgi:PAS domain S-box-containing protein
MSPVKNAIIEMTIAVTVISTEITRTRQLEKALATIEAQYQTLVESTRDSIYTVDKDCRYLYMNSHHKQRLGIQGDGYKGKAYHEYHPPVVSERFRGNINQVLQTKQSYKERYTESDRSFIRTFSPVLDEGGNDVTAVVIISIEPASWE